MKTATTFVTVMLLCAAAAGQAWAQQGQGPVSTACKDDIPKYCAGKEHGQGEIRDCLEANKDKVSAACKTALETTGRGR